MNNIITKDKGEIFCVDFLGPLPKTTREIQHLILYIDAFTKLVKLYAITRATTKAVLNVIIKKYSREHGQGKRVLRE